MTIPKGFFVFKNKLFKHNLHKNDFPGHEGRPGQVGGSKPKSGSGGQSLEKRKQGTLSKMDDNELRKHMRQANVGLGKYSRADLMDEMKRRRGIRKKEAPGGIPGLHAKTVDQSLRNPKSPNELKATLRGLGGVGDKRTQIGNTLESSGWRYDSSFQGAGSPSGNIYYRGKYNIIVEFEKNKTKVSLESQ
jgi:hypothetical protein